MDTLKALVESKIRDDRLSVRSAAAELEVSHTTIHRVLDGKPVDFDTVVKLCNWLGVKVSTVLNVETGGNDSVMSAISAIVEKDSRLAELFTELANDLKTGDVSPSDVADIVSYAAYRLKNAKQKSNGVHTEDR